MALCLGNALVLLAILLAAEAAPAEKEYGPSCGYGGTPHCKSDCGLRRTRLPVTIPPKPLPSPFSGGGGSSRIFGGRPAIPQEFPWLAALWKKRRGEWVVVCGATLIGEGWVLSAAHCVEQWETIADVKLSLLDHDRTKEDGEVTLRAKSIHRHPLYQNGSRHNNDFVLLELQDHPALPHLVPACLPHDEMESFAGATGVAAGWGRNESWLLPDIPHVLEPMEILSNEECAERIGSRDKVTEEMVCTFVKGPGRRHVCKGDSGGPLVTAEAHAGVGPRYVLVGVTSWSWHCAVAHPIPDVFARVTTALGWIEAVSGIKPCCPPSPPEWEP